jgi:hypothetical protein
MPTHTLPVVQCNRDEVGVIVRVRPILGPPVLLDAGFYRISMSSGCVGTWALGVVPSLTVGSIIASDSSQIIYVPTNGTGFQCFQMPSSINDGELSINPLRAWTMPGNDPRQYDLFPLA